MEVFGGTGKRIQEKGFGGAMGEEWDIFKADISRIGGNIGDWIGSRGTPEPATVTVNNSPSITINGAKDPDATGKAVEEYMSKESQKAYERYAGEKKEK
jgi:hypothetical protein